MQISRIWDKDLWPEMRNLLGKKTGPSSAQNCGDKIASGLFRKRSKTASKKILAGFIQFMELDIGL